MPNASPLSGLNSVWYKTLCKEFRKHTKHRGWHTQNTQDSKQTHKTQYGCSNDGRRRYQSDGVYTAAEKLKELIVETHTARKRYCRDFARDVVQEKELQIMLRDWKNECRLWMCPETLQGRWKMSDQQWHKCLETLWPHLLQLMGCHEMAVCSSPHLSKQRELQELLACLRRHCTHGWRQTGLRCTVETSETAYKTSTNSCSAQLAASESNNAAWSAAQPSADGVSCFCVHLF